MPVLVGDVGTSRVEDAEGTAEVPERDANVVRGKDLQDIAEPCEHDIVRCLVEGTALSTVDAKALGGKLRPRGVGGLKVSTVPGVAVVPAESVES